MMSAHVDGTVIARRENDCNNLCKLLKKSFPTNNLEELAHCIRCAFTPNREKDTPNITQLSRIDKLTGRFHVTHWSPTATCKTVHMIPRGEGEEKYTERYMKVVSGLMWLTNTTRSDIAIAVCIIACFAQEQSKQHWNTVLGML